jgi:hypothetical protein
MAKFNYEQIRQSIAKSESGAKRVITAMEKKFEASKVVFLQEFDSHPVTKEIQSGDGNPSGTLGGYGNLRSFIGFENGDDPITPVREVLATELKLARGTRRIKGQTIQYTFSIRIPQQSISKASRMPWESGKSWVFGIENGISGFSHYLSGRFNTPEPSRSGKGIQVEHNVRGGTFARTQYLSELFDKLVARIK